jgi:hypothetical protein
MLPRRDGGWKLGVVKRLIKPDENALVFEALIDNRASIELRNLYFLPIDPIFYSYLIKDVDSAFTFEGARYADSEAD